MKTTCILAFIVLALLVAVPAFAETPLEETAFTEDIAQFVPKGSGGNETVASAQQSDSGASAQENIGNVAGAVEKTTDLASMTCGIGGIGPAGGLAAVPCIAAQGVNIIATGISWLFSK